MSEVMSRVQERTLGCSTSLPSSVTPCLNSPARVGTVMRGDNWLITTPKWTYLFHVVQGQTAKASICRKNRTLFQFSQEGYLEVFR